MWEGYSRCGEVCEDYVYGVGIVDAWWKDGRLDIEGDAVVWKRGMYCVIAIRSEVC
jgi:hypothetical protein